MSISVISYIAFSYLMILGLDFLGLALSKPLELGWGQVLRNRVQALLVPQGVPAGGAV
jgi:hypothetical protein